MQSVIGLDLSLVHTGVAVGVVDNSSHHFTSFVVSCKEKGPYRLDLIRKRIKHILGEDLSGVAIEGYSFGSKGRGIYGIGELGGIIRLMLYNNRCNAIIVPPSVLKKFVCDKGNAPKDKVVSCYNEQFDEHFLVKENNEVDALGLARIAAAYFLNDYTELNERQVDMIKGIEEKCKVWCFRRS